MLCFEWWAFELLAICAGYMGVAALAAEVVIINIVAFLFMMPLGVSFAASSLVGGAIGSKNVPLARGYARQAMYLTIGLSSLVVILIAIFSDNLSSLFSSDPDVIEEVRNVLYVIIAYVWLDAIHGVQSGVIRGLGR